MNKPTITLSNPLGFYLKDGKLISDQEAREIWYDRTADWSQGAYSRMVSTMLKTPQSLEDATNIPHQEQSSEKD